MPYALSHLSIAAGAMPSTFSGCKMRALTSQVCMLIGANSRELFEGKVISREAECWAQRVAHTLGLCTITPCLTGILGICDDVCCVDEVSCTAVAHCSPSLKQ